MLENKLKDPRSISRTQVAKPDAVTELFVTVLRKQNQEDLLGLLARYLVDFMRPW